MKPNADTGLAAALTCAVDSAAARYGAAPPVSRVATAIATRRAWRPALNPADLCDPYGAKNTGRGNSAPAPDGRGSINGSPPPGLQRGPIKIKSQPKKSLPFQGIATDCHQRRVCGQL
jgi:hypothetical protein